MITDYQRLLRARYLAAPVMAAPLPWQAVSEHAIPIGGLLGVGFVGHPDSGHDLLMVVSNAGHGLFDTVTGERIARDADPDSGTSTPDSNPDLTCPGLGPVAGTPVRIAGLLGGGLNSTTPDGWTVDAISPEWPHHRVLLSADGGAHDGPAGGTWWHVFHSDYSELRAAGFSPSGLTMTVTTSSDVTLWTRTELSLTG
ncbi:hypothetical protein ABT160_38530 [Streptomyces sp. NPDC001941]|uniref:hypothetical protein n=1 Tax=Streptomyces sp. NPDC001941 TaxID=3154659 RepID=UPI003333A59C